MPALTLQEQESAYDQRDVGLLMLSKGVIAGIISIVGDHAIHDLCIYRLPGLMSCIALLFYIVIMFFCILTMPKVQLTLPSIAEGAILHRYGRRRKRHYL